MRQINLIVVHCSATKQDIDVSADDIRSWHVNGNGWSDIGYHYVIRRSGVIEKGREDDVAGAHAQGYNAYSLGVCLVGGSDADDVTKAEFNYTRKQLASLEKLLTALKVRYPNANILGHKDLPNVTKACPGFDVRAWWEN